MNILTGYVPVRPLAVSTPYAVLQKPPVTLADRVVTQIPQDLFDRLPTRVVSFIAAYREPTPERPGEITCRPARRL